MIIAMYWLFAFYAVYYIDWVGYSQTNGLSNHIQDFDILFDDKENNNE